MGNSTIGTLQGTRSQWHRQRSFHAVCVLACPPPRTDLQGNVHTQDIPQAMEGVQHGGPEKAVEAQLHAVKCASTNSTFEHDCQNSFSMCCGRLSPNGGAAWGPA